MMKNTVENATPINGDTQLRSADLEGIEWRYGIKCQWTANLFKRLKSLQIVGKTDRQMWYITALPTGQAIPQLVYDFPFFPLQICFRENKPAAPYSNYEDVDV